MKKDPRIKKEILLLRKEIDKVDNDLLNLIAERRKLSLKIIKVKSRGEKPAREAEREKEIVNRMSSLAKKKKLDVFFISGIYKEIIEDSVNLQREYLSGNKTSPVSREKISFAIQGIEGSYSYLAARKFFNSDENSLKLVSKKRFNEVFDSAENGEADYAVLPIENTTSGGINEVHDLLLNTSLQIVGEEIYRINHCLAAIKKVPLSGIKKIYAHYQAEAQCSNFIASLKNCSLEYFPDTAMSFRKIKEEKNPSIAAIAGEDAAKLYGLKILRRNIANQSGNFTRFLVLSQNPSAPPEGVPCKTSIIMSTSNKAGSLADVLIIFKRNSINLTRIISRPVAGCPWDEMFFIDFEGNSKDRKIQKILKTLETKTTFLKILGSYPICNYSYL